MLGDFGNGAESDGSGHRVIRLGGQFSNRVQVFRLSCTSKLGNSTCS